MALPPCETMNKTAGFVWWMGWGKFGVFGLVILETFCRRRGTGWTVPHWIPYPLGFIDQVTVKVITGLLRYTEKSQRPHPCVYGQQ